MPHHRFASTRNAVRLLAGVIICSLFVVAAGPAYSPIGASDSRVVQIVLQVNDTTVSPLGTEYRLSVFLTNTIQEVGGFQMILSAFTSGLMRIPDSTRIDTTIVCIDTIDCDPADTIIDTLSISPVDLTGSVIENWELVEARAESPYIFSIAGAADLPGGTSPPPIPPASTGPHLLFTLMLEREVTLDVLDTLQDRTVAWRMDPFVTSFSDPTGQTIGLLESTYCVDSLCDTLDTVYYVDTTARIYVDGAVTFGPSCLAGDADASGSVSATDIIYLVHHIFRGGPPPACDGAAGDVNCSGSLTMTDIVFLVAYVWKSGPAPCIA